MRMNLTTWHWMADKSNNMTLKGGWIKHMTLNCGWIKQQDIERRLNRTTLYWKAEESKNMTLKGELQLYKIDRFWWILYKMNYKKAFVYTSSFDFVISKWYAHCAWSNGLCPHKWHAHAQMTQTCRTQMACAGTNSMPCTNTCPCSNVISMQNSNDVRMNKWHVQAQIACFCTNDTHMLYANAMCTKITYGGTNDMHNNKWHA